LADGYKTAANAAIGFGTEATRQLDFGRSAAEAAAHPVQTLEGIEDGILKKIDDTATVHENFGFGAAVAEATGISGMAEGIYNADVVTGQPIGDGWDRFTRFGQGFRSALEFAGTVGGGAARAMTYLDAANVATIAKNRGYQLRVLNNESRFVAGTEVLEGDGDKIEIEDVRVGTRVATDAGQSNYGTLADDPNATRVNRKRWRLVTIEAEHVWADGTVDTWEVQTLQPVRWLRRHDVNAGEAISLGNVLDLN
jgi:hypothetical protein